MWANWHKTIRFTVTPSVKQGLHFQEPHNICPAVNPMRMEALCWAHNDDDVKSRFWSDPPSPECDTLNPF